MKRKIAIIAVGVAVLSGSIALSKAKDESRDKAAAPVAKEDAGKNAAEQTTSKTKNQYWLGLRCVAPVPEMVRAHIDVPGDGGVFVADVLPKGPAAKAGVKRHDIIISAGDKRLEEVADLVAVVDRSQGKEISLKILRGGKRQEIKITPQIRPDEYFSRGPLNFPQDSRWKELGRLFEENRPGKDGKPPLRMRFMHPGIILPPLPMGMTVDISRKDEGPAEIIVKYKDKEWKVTPDTLDELPPEIRPYAEQMIGKMITAPLPSPGMTGDRLKMLDPAEIEKKFDQHYEKQMEAVNRQMKRLEKMAEALRERGLLKDEPEMPELEINEEPQPEPEKDKPKDK